MTQLRAACPGHSQAAAEVVLGAGAAHAVEHVLTITALRGGEAARTPRAVELESPTVVASRVTRLLLGTLASRDSSGTMDRLDDTASAAVLLTPRPKS